MSLLFGKSWDKESISFGHTVDIYGINDELYETNHPIKYRIKRALEKIGLLKAVSRLNR